MGATGAGFFSLLIVGGIFLAIAWIALPFAMFGMKPLLRELIRETRETNALLRAHQSPKQGHAEKLI